MKILGAVLEVLANIVITQFTLAKTEIIYLGTIHLRCQHVLGGGGGSPWADGQKVTVNKAKFKKE